MSPHDEERLAKLVAEFVADCGLEPPLYLLAIGSNGSSVTLSHHGVDADAQLLCTHRVGAGMLAPIIVTAVAMDGRSASARIEITEAAPRQ